MRAIASLKVGDQVLAYNPATKQPEAEPVQHVWLNHGTAWLMCGWTFPPP